VVSLPSRVVLLHSDMCRLKSQSDNPREVAVYTISHVCTKS